MQLELAMPDLVVIHTSDLHGRLSPNAADRLHQLKYERRAILLDGGDAVTIPNILPVPWKPRVLALMERAGYDAMAMGNREFFFRSWGIRSLARAAFPLVATNLEAPASAGITPMAVVESPAGSVAVLALARKMIAPNSWLAALSDLRWLPPEECLPAALEQARQRSDWVVLLSHLGATADLDLLQRGLGGDLLLGGHDHILTPSGPIDPASVPVHSGWHGRWASLVRVQRASSHLSADVEVVSLR